MIKYQSLKTAAFVVSALMFMTIANEPTYATQSENPVSVEYGIAGISKTLNDVFSCGDEEVNDKITELFNAEIYSPLSNLGVSIAS
ncbi:MAG: hypothetical protein GX237_08420, partial [Clostridiales bacterium]|nr:hypothetical protein [Clostridiales bacterium]